jgi:hypothetical protein
MLPNCEPFRVELSDEVQAVIAALRVLERPLESSIAELQHAIHVLGSAAKERSEWYLPFEVNLAVEFAQRAWAAIYATWKAKDEAKAIVLIRALKKQSVGCSKLSELHRAIAHDWDPSGDPPAIAVEALKAWDDGSTILRNDYKMTPEAATIWFWKCPDASILKKLSSYLLLWCKCRVLRHRRWIWAFHDETVFAPLLEHTPFVEAWIAAVPRMYPHLTEKGIAVRVAIVRKVANNPRIKMSKEERSDAFAMYERIKIRGTLRQSHWTFKGEYTSARDRKTLGWRAK